ncbi:MAG: URC4/urg3 family protein [Oscillatoriales cyanobacterium C42_A2020_001]|nr:URC4/urg3 family protein [Leptolyngbyaceae cyanobacterium C42_A2020_001]
MTEINSTASIQTAIAYLRSPQAIRDRCGQLFELACADRLRYFRVDLSQLETTADYVLQVIRETYPNLEVPFHSRWRHFEVGKSPRLEQLKTRLAGLPPRDRAKAKLDLAIISVLLDAGAGSDWNYVEASTGEVFKRSEGLAVASFQMFCDGLFSSSEQALQVDAIALQNLSQTTLEQGFQVNPSNPLIGVEGRVALLQRLGAVLTQHQDLFGRETPRPGNLVDFLQSQSQGETISATTVLNVILTGFSDIWAGRLTLGGINLGDTWTHSALKPDSLSPISHSPSSTFVPFHKLSQWLTYSLLEPLQELGFQITGLTEMTGLPEYRNGGLCVDLGLLQVKNPSILQQPQPVDAEAIVEWRALTVICLDRIADTMRTKLGMTTETLPLVKVLQGGTWTAGRKIAAELRPGGIPPIQIVSDGTVF